MIEGIKRLSDDFDLIDKRPFVPTHGPRAGLGKAPQKPEDCLSCQLNHLSGSTWSRPEGKCTNGVLAIGESLGDKEQEDGLPFRPHAQAGSVLERAFKRLGIDRQQFGLWNLIGCKPPNNQLGGTSWEVPAIRHCQKHFRQVVQEFQPKVLLALGGLPAAYLTGLHGGDKMGIQMIRGYVLDGKGRHQMVNPPGWEGFLDADMEPETRHLAVRDDIVQAYNLPVVPTFHPSFIARKSDLAGEAKTHVLLGVLIRDIAYAIQVARNGYRRPSHDGYRINPPREAIESAISLAVRNPSWIVYWDVETYESLVELDESNLVTVNKITQFQFGLSGQPGVVYVMPWDDPYIFLIKRLMGLPNSKCAFNGDKFDIPVARAHDIPIIGRQMDTMWKWKFWQPDWPRGLQFSASFYALGAEPWKHLSASDPGNYGGMDIHYLQLTEEGVTRELDRAGLLRTYDRLVRDHETYVLSRATERGMPINSDKLIKFGEKLEVMKSTLSGQMNEIVPEEMKNCSPKEGYVKDPKDVSGLVRRVFTVEAPTVAECPNCEGRCQVMVLKTIGKKLKGVQGIGSQTGVGSDPLGREATGGVPDNEQPCSSAKPAISGVTVTSSPQKFVRKKCPVCKGKGEIKGEKSVQQVERWCKVVEFSPSSQQLLRYIKAQKHEVPLDMDSGRETTAQKEVEHLARKYPKDPMYPLVLEYRKVDKLKGTYVGKFSEEKGWHGGFIPGPDGFVHPKFLNTPATGQLAATDPPALTLPKHKDLAKEFRAAVEAKPGHKLIECDYGSFHVRTLGLEAKDPTYMKLAELDMHSFVTAHGLRIPEAEKLYDLAFSNEKEFKSIIKFYRTSPKLYDGKTFGERRDDQFKKAILGIGFGEGPNKLFRLNRDCFSSVREVMKIQGTIKGLFPKIFEFQDRIVRVAYQQRYLQSRWFWRRWFWDVLHYDPKTSSMVQGEDSEAAMAFLPSNDAHGMFRDLQMRMEEKGWLEKWNFFLPYHDALYFHCPDKLVEECVFHVRQEMEKPVPQLADPDVCPDGFTCKVEIKVGPDLKNQEKID